MCKAKKYTEQLLNIYDEIENDLKYYNYHIRELVLLEQDLLHTIENGKFNVAEGYKLAKMIKDARNKRRDCKMEVETLVNLKKSFCDKNIYDLKDTHNRIKRQDEVLLKLKEYKVYNPRVLKSIEIRIVAPLNRRVI